MAALLHRYFMATISTLLIHMHPVYLTCVMHTHKTEIGEGREKGETHIYPVQLVRNAKSCTTVSCNRQGCKIPGDRGKRVLGRAPAEGGFLIGTEASNNTAGTLQLVSEVT